MKIFVSYCHQNKDWVEDDGKYQLIPWLRLQLGKDVIFWTDQLLKHHVGEEYRKHIFNNIQDSDIALLLISQEFTSSEFIYNEELPLIKKRFDKKKLKIIPLLISQLSREGRRKISWIFELQTIPNDVKPILNYTANEIEYTNIKITILNALEEQIENIHTELSSLESKEEYNQEKNESKGIDQVNSTIKSAENGNAVAQNNLGIMYSEGKGVSQDYTKAMEWFQKSSDQGYANAQYNLGLMYYNGYGVTQDYSKAVEWFRKSANQGYAAAQYNLGVMYAIGQGVPLVLSKAIEWCRKAADQGYDIAKKALKLMD